VEPAGAYLTGVGANTVEHAATGMASTVLVCSGMGCATVSITRGGAGNAWENAPNDTNDGAEDSMSNDGDMTSVEKSIGGGGGADTTLRASPSAGGAGNAVRSVPNERDADIENDDKAEAIMLEMSGVDGVRVKVGMAVSAGARRVIARAQESVSGSDRRGVIGADVAESTCLRRMHVSGMEHHAFAGIVAHER
jgi:hypothetical protein